MGERCRKKYMRMRTCLEPLTGCHPPRKGRGYILDSWLAFKNTVWIHSLIAWPRSLTFYFIYLKIWYLIGNKIPNPNPNIYLIYRPNLVQQDCICKSVVITYRLTIFNKVQLTCPHCAPNLKRSKSNSAKENKQKKNKYKEQQITFYFIKARNKVFIAAE